MVVVVGAGVSVVGAGVVCEVHWAEELPPMPVKYLPCKQLWHVVLDGAAAAVE